jgi:predicted O-linked N-acetylglucosamine transferase (SPINDLY family)
MLGLGDLIAKDIAAYIDLAAQLATNKDARAAFRQRIADNKQKVYRDRAPITALEDLIETAVRSC